MKPPTLPLTVIALLSCSLNAHTSAAVIDETFTATVNGTIHAITVGEEGSLLIGGEFSEVSGTTRNHLAKISATGDLIAEFAPNLDGAVFALGTRNNGSVVVGGAFSSPTPHLAYLQPDGSFTLPPIGSGTSSRINCLAVGLDDSVTFGGPFRRLNGGSAIYAARLDALGAIDATFNSSLLSSMSIEAGADAIAVQNDGKVIVGGNFNTAHGFSSLVRLNSDGSMDEEFSSENGSILYPKVIEILDTGKILLAGVANSSGEGFVRRLNGDGSIDTSFAEVTFDGCVETVARAEDDTLLVGGSFSGGLARLHPDGTRDAGWNITTDGLVKAIAFVGTDTAIIGGAFQSVDGKPRYGIARIILKAQALSATNSNGRFSARLQGQIGKRYQVEASTDLANWSVIGITVATEGGITVDDDLARVHAHRFYRARMVN
jgi:uncharacterized delta-60 repeat protein